MKRTTFLSLLLLIFHAIQVMGGSNWNPSRRKPFEDLRKPVVLKLSPFHFFDKQLSLSGEFFSKNYRQSTTLSLNLIYEDNSQVYDAGGSINVERRFYPRGFSPDSMFFSRNSASGFYVGLGIQAGYSEYNDREGNLYVQPDTTWFDQINKNYSLNPKDNNVTITSRWILPNVTVGYQLILWEALYLDIFVGGGIKINDTRKTSPNQNLNFAEYYKNPDIISRYYKGIAPRVGVTLGIAL